jgi:hypothetical protein
MKRIGLPAAGVALMLITFFAGIKLGHRYELREASGVMYRIDTTSGRTELIMGDRAIAVH